MNLNFKSSVGQGKSLFFGKSNDGKKTLLRPVNLPSTPEGDPYINNVSLLMHMDGTNDSQIFTDSSNNNLTIIPVTNTSINTTIKKFGTASAYFDGSSGLEIDSSNLFAFDSANFTIEFWSYPTSAGNRSIINKWSGSGAFFITTTTVYINVSTAGNYTQNLNTWNHVAVVRNGIYIQLYLNGNLVFTYNIGGASLETNNAQLKIGNSNIALPNFVGYLDELRITKGIARYTANFNPPTQAFPNS